MLLFFFSSRRRHTRWTGDWSSDVCSSDLPRRRDPNRACYPWVALAPRESSAARLASAAVVEEVERGTSDAVTRPRKKRLRSEERRVGKECRSRGSADH